MNTKKTYTVIAVILAIVFSYNLFWIFKALLNFNRYSFQLRFIINYIPPFIGITGLVIFITSKFKRSNLLRVYMCFEIISFPLLIIFYVKYLAKTTGAYINTLPLGWTVYLGLFFSLCVFVVSIVGLRILSFNKTANLTFINYENERSAQFSPAPAGLRFANRLIDALMIFYILWINSYTLMIYFRNDYDVPIFIYVLFEIFLLLIYYILLEGVFNTTAGKCATNTTIVNMQGERPSFAQILGRTFCRLIPFEAFTFLGEGARGWHDSITNTYVTDCINREDFEMNEFTLDAELNDSTNENYYSAG